MNPHERIDYLIRELINDHPEHKPADVETAVLLAALELNSADNRDAIRATARKLLAWRD